MVPNKTATLLQKQLNLIRDGFSKEFDIERSVLADTILLIDHLLAKIAELEGKPK